MTEEWRPLTVFDSLYEVSDQGRVRSVGRTVTQRNRWGSASSYWQEGRILTPGADSSGYLQVTISICGDQFRPLVHHLVLAAFGPDRPAGSQADHVNGDRRDNAVTNLRWASVSDNGRNRHHIRNKHGVIGVIKTRSPINPFMAMARDSAGNKRYLGSFPTKEEAGAAYAAFREKQYAWAK